MTRLQESLHPIKEFSLFIRENPFSRDKKTLILIHGIGVSGRYFLPLFNALSEQYNVIIIDFPGYGNAPKPRHPLSLITLSMLLEQFIVERKLLGCVLIGHSMGCQIIANLIARNEGVISKTVLIAPTINRFERSIFLQSLRLAQDTFRESFKANKIIIIDYLKMGIVRYLQTTRWMIHDKIENHLYDTRIPVLLVRGSKDSIVPKKWLESLRSRSDSISMAEVPEAPHAVQVNFAKEVASLCDTFIKK